MGLTSAISFKTGLVYALDCGEFGKNLKRALAMVGYTGFERHGEEAWHQPHLSDQAGEGRELSGAGDHRQARPRSRGRTPWPPSWSHCY
jgi:hypothetical protein